MPVFWQKLPAGVVQGTFWGQEAIRYGTSQDPRVDVTHLESFFGQPSNREQPSSAMQPGEGASSALDPIRATTVGIFVQKLQNQRYTLEEIRRLVVSCDPRLWNGDERFQPCFTPC